MLGPGIFPRGEEFSAQKGGFPPNPFWEGPCAPQSFKGAPAFWFENSGEEAPQNALWVSPKGLWGPFPPRLIWGLPCPKISLGGPLRKLTPGAPKSLRGFSPQSCLGPLGKGKTRKWSKKGKFGKEPLVKRTFPGGNPFKPPQIGEVFPRGGFVSLGMPQAQRDPLGIPGPSPGPNSRRLGAPFPFQVAAFGKPGTVRPIPRIPVKERPQLESWLPGKPGCSESCRANLSGNPSPGPIIQPSEGRLQVWLSSEVPLTPANPEPDKQACILGRCTVVAFNQASCSRFACREQKQCRDNRDIGS